MSVVQTDAGSVELVERDLPPHLVPRARQWFAAQTRQLEKAHGSHWPANREWLLDYLQAELHDLICKERAHAA